MLKNYLLKLKIYHLDALKKQKGQSLIIFVFAILGLIAMMGLALDLGLVYIERVRISRTTDAAALAAVVELPFEEEAIRRAAEFIELNGYNRADTEIRVRGCIERNNTLGNYGEGTTNPADPGNPYGVNNPIDIQPDSLTAGYVYQPATSGPARNIFVIDTLAFQPVDRDNAGNVTTPNKDNCGDSGGAKLYGTANKLRVSGESMVTMNFMRFFGFGQVPVSDQATGENVTNLDVMVVFDVSGSMQFETTCFGCWVEDTSLEDTIAEVMQNPYPLNGDFYPLTYRPPSGGGPYDIFWGGDPGDYGNPAKAVDNPLKAQVCSALPEPWIQSGYKYSVHEAEFYSHDSPTQGWVFEKRTPGQGFWVLQRQNRGSNNAYIRTHPFPVYSQSNPNENPKLQGGSYNHECFDDAGGLTGECWKSRADSIGEAAPSNPPYVEYDFTVNWANDPDSNKRKTHIWIRAIGGSDHGYEWYGTSAGALNTWRKSVYWQVDTDSVKGGPFDNLRVSAWDSVNNGDWRWIKIAHNLNLSDGPHVLRIYQGSAGFNLDKIIITNRPDNTVGDSRTSWFFDGNEGPDASPGSATREACNMCNPVFGQPVDINQCTCKKDATDTGGTIYGGGGTGFGCTQVLTATNQLENDLYHGIDPLRSAQEAVKNFAARLDPKFDQIGVVAYSSGIVSRIKLQCLRYAGNNLTGGTAKCYDPSQNPITYTHVIKDVENRNPTGSTDIAEGLREGLQELGISTHNATATSECETLSADNGKACDRRGAARRVLILMTDGSPNQNPGCPNTVKWRGRVGNNDQDYNCVMYYASQAVDNNVIVYTIGIGSGVNRELLTAAAEGLDPNPPPGDDGFYFEGKGGKYFPAAKPSDLDAIFEEILNNIFVRIVG